MGGGGECHLVRGDKLSFATTYEIFFILQKKIYVC